ncbi:MAG: WD40 repeat domain-containing protein, partial [Planctomycetota bacterium]
MKRQSYFANITAADAGLSSFEPLRAQHRLGECDASFRRWEWQHLTARADASLQVLVESRGPFSLAGSRDGQRIAVGASSQIVRVLDVNSNTLLLEAKLTMPIVCAALNHDGSLLAVGCLDGTVPLWDVNAKQSLAVLGDARPIVNGPAVYGAAALAFDPTGTRLVVGGDDQLARVWNLASRDVAVTLRHNGTVQAVAVSPDGRWIATGTVDNTIRVWDANSGQLSSTLVGHQSSGATQDSIAGFGGVLALDFHPSGELLASGAADATIRIWDLAARTSRLVLRGSRASITSIQFSADGKLLASASSDSMVRTWQVDSGELVHEYLGHSNRATAVCFALSGSELVSSSWDGTVRTWSLEVAEPITTMKDDMPINGLSFFDDARRIVTTHVDGGARVWDSVTGQLTQVLACERSARIEPYQGAAAAATSPDGKRLFIATNSMVHVFDAVSLAPLGKWQPPRTPLNSLAISGSRLVTGSWSSDVALWNSESGALVKHWNVPDGLFRVTISNDATLLAASSQEGIIRIWDAETGERRLELPAMQGVIFGLAFSPDGLSLLASTVTGSLQVFDTDTGDVVLDLVGQQAGSLAVVYSPDGSR